MGKQIVTTTKVLSSTHVVAVPIVSAETVYTSSFLMGSAEHYTLKRKATSGGTVGLKIELEISDVRPTTEGAVDTTNYAVPKNFADVESDLTDENLGYNNISPPPCVYGRFKITGSGSNAATTTITMTLMKQTEI